MSEAVGAAAATGAVRADRGVVIWLTGLPSAGKSTIASALAPALRARGERVEVLDGDVVRENLSKGLGFAKEDRDINIRRIGFVAELLARNGVKVITAAISPYRAIRDEVRALAGEHFLEVYIATPLEVCESRDVKGLYAKARSGQLSGFTGVDDPYEPPLNPEVEIATQGQTVEESAARIIDALVERGYLDAR
ncbi:MAG TPA: adenylyl-sulfate kinase [Actinomycetota bacterium]|nr:adenylyl-sulfate kinase [Actinomycetota bacterium]